MYQDIWGSQFAPPKQILQGRMISSPSSSICFLSIVAQYCSLLWTVADTDFVYLNTLNAVMQRTANEKAAGLRRICKRSDQPKK